MKVVYSDIHRRHAPESEITREGHVPYFECPQRAETILQALRETPGSRGISRSRWMVWIG